MNKCEQYCQTIKRMCNSIKPLLPPEYQQVNYLQSVNTSTQHPGINIGSLANHQYFDIYFEWVSFNTIGIGAQYNVNGLLGCNSYGENDVKAWLTKANKLNFVVGTTTIGSADITTGVKYHAYLSPTQYTLDGQDYTTATATTSSTVNCYVFSVNVRDNPWTNWCSSIKLYRLKTSSIDLYPCYRKSDNKPGMYDIVNDTFYTNIGSGEFTVGNDVL